jgi:2-isopropylmalate synthase
MKTSVNKYRPFPAIALTDRQWPSKTITSAPRWLSTDLRDGNQALFEPMSVEQKLEVFEMLCNIGFKEIEVGFPSASDTEFQFMRRLIDEDRIPTDVTVQVLTQSRDTLVARTMESLVGARRAVVHVYNATSATFRDTVFKMTQEQVLLLAIEGVKQVKTLSQAPSMAATLIELEYSAECFSATELPFAKQVCEAVAAAWGATPDNKIILNLPATVEGSTPNIYADQIEWMHRNLNCRDSVVLSVHPHNDRGTAVAAAELSLMAGAERVEGCLFGNGERTGNVDLVTLALNLHSQGVDCVLDFSRLNEVASVVQRCTQLPIHPRHPYAGDLVFTAFSGSHQDAIKKGMDARHTSEHWDVPYLPVDPKDLGRTYDSLIRVNSQSGKGGIAYLLESHYGMVMPRRLQVEFSAHVQKHADATGTELVAKTLWSMFEAEYLHTSSPVYYMRHALFDATDAQPGREQGIHLDLGGGRTAIRVTGFGNGPISAAVDALATLTSGGSGAGGSFAKGFKVLGYEERSMGEGADSRACAFVEAQCDSVTGARFGVGLHVNIVTASMLALVSAYDRLVLARN